MAFPILFENFIELFIKLSVMELSCSNYQRCWKYIGIFFLVELCSRDVGRSENLLGVCSSRGLMEQVLIIIHPKYEWGVIGPPFLTALCRLIKLKAILVRQWALKLVYYMIAVSRCCHWAQSIM